jgi:hypothetical protein
MVCRNLGSFKSNMVSPPITQGYHVLMGGWKSKNPLNHVDKLVDYTNLWCALVGLKHI